MHHCVTLRFSRTRTRSNRTLGLLSGLVLSTLAAAAHPSDAEPGRAASGGPEWGTVATPLRMVNLNPFHLLYGVPASAGVRVLAPDSWELIASTDIASYLSEDASGAEEILMDGETYRLALAWRRGFRERFEYLLEVSEVAHRGGAFDEFIENWHDLFGLPQGNRDKVPHGRLALRHVDASGVGIDIREDRFALGDISLGLGYAVPDWPFRNDGPAIRTSVKLPTGDEDALAGSGGFAGSACTLP